MKEKKTIAHRKYDDNVQEKVKQSRLVQVINTFQTNRDSRRKRLIGTQQLVLVEGFSKKTDMDLCGRTDCFIKVVFPRIAIPDLTNNQKEKTERVPKRGDYVSVCIIDAVPTLKAQPIEITTLHTFSLSANNKTTISFKSS